MASIANTIGVISILLGIIRLIDLGRWVRGADLERCIKEKDRLQRLLENRRERREDREDAGQRAGDTADRGFDA